MVNNLSRLARCLPFFLVTVLVSCSSNLSLNSSSGQNDVWQNSGSIVVARQIPDITTSPSTLLGFIPFAEVSSSPWLLFQRQASKVVVMNGSEKIFEARGEGVPRLAPGRYQIMHKQRGALWYAPDEYFTARNLPIPAQGDRNRYLRGALGEFVFYLDKKTPVYSGPIWDQMLGGVRIDPNDLSRIYYTLKPGAFVEVR